MIMKNKLLASFLLMSFVSSSTAMSQGNVPSPDAKPSVVIPQPPAAQPNEPDVGAAISPMKRNQLAPFTGVLLSPAAVASIIADINSKNDAIKIEVDKATKTLAAKHEYEVSLLKLRGESDTKISQVRIEEQRKELDRVDAQLKKEREDRPNPMTWASVGLGIGIIVTTLTASAIVYATRQ